MSNNVLDGLDDLLSDLGVNLNAQTSTDDESEANPDLDLIATADDLLNKNKSPIKVTATKQEKPVINLQPPETKPDLKSVSQDSPKAKQPETKTINQLPAEILTDPFYHNVTPYAIHRFNKELDVNANELLAIHNLSEPDCALLMKKMSFKELRKFATEKVCRLDSQLSRVVFNQFRDAVKYSLGSTDALSTHEQDYYDNLFRHHGSGMPVHKIVGLGSLTRPQLDEKKSFFKSLMGSNNSISHQPPLSQLSRTMMLSHEYDDSTLVHYLRDKRGMGVLSNKNDKPVFMEHKTRLVSHASQNGHDMQSTLDLMMMRIADMGLNTITIKSGSDEYKLRFYEMATDKGIKVSGYKPPQPDVKPDLDIEFKKTASPVLKMA